MGVQTRGLDIAINAKRQVADAAARAEAKAVVERWNDQLAASRDMLWSPTIRAALIAETPWLDVFCPGCGTTLYWELELYPDVLGVAGGAFTDPALPRPVRSVWTQHRHDWVGLPEGIEHFAQGSQQPKT